MKDIGENSQGSFEETDIDAVERAENWFFVYLALWQVWN